MTLYMDSYPKKECLEIYYKLTKLNKEVGKITIGNFDHIETRVLLADTRIQIDKYQTKVPKTLKGKFKFDIKDLENKVKIAEDCIKYHRNLK